VQWLAREWGSNAHYREESSDDISAPPVPPTANTAMMSTLTYTVSVQTSGRGRGLGSGQPHPYAETKNEVAST